MNNFLVTTFLVTIFLVTNFLVTIFLVTIFSDYFSGDHFLVITLSVTFLFVLKKIVEQGSIRRAMINFLWRSKTHQRMVLTKQLKTNDFNVERGRTDIGQIALMI